jgi:hypothetical protein
MEEFLNGLTLTGIPVIILLPAVVGLLKQLGLRDSWTGVAAAVVGILVAFAIQAVETWPYIEPWVRVVVIGVLLGLGANGVYSQYRHITKTRAADAAKEEPVA